MAKKECFWFIRPLDSHTNEVISRELDARGLAEENLQRIQICEDGKRHNFLECPIELIAYLWTSRDDLNLKFKIYSRSGKRGKIREVTFLYKQKPKQKTPVKTKKTA